MADPMNAVWEFIPISLKYIIFSECVNNYYTQEQYNYGSDNSTKWRSRLTYVIVKSTVSGADDMFTTVELRGGG